MKLTAAIQNIFDLRPSARSNRYGWVDYAKGMAILFVVYRHILHGFINAKLPVEQWVINGNDMLYSFRMPLFFALSGLFFASSLHKKGWANFLVSKVNTLLYPYLLWAVIQITLQIVFAKYVNAQRGPMDYLNIFIQPRGLDQLWYLFALFNVTALFLFTTVLLRLPAIGQVVLGLVLLGFAPLLKDISTFYDVMLHYFFFALGSLIAPVFFAENVQKKLSNGLGLLLLLPLFAASQYYFLFHQEMNLYLYAVIAIVGSLFVIMLSSFLSKHEWLSWLTVIGHYSLYIYLLHVMIASFIRHFLVMTPLVHHIPLMLAILIVVAIFLSIIVYRICILLRLGFLFKGPFKESYTKQTVPAATKISA